MSKEGMIVALVGGQFGSEGKGIIAHHLANDFGVHVRVGGPNAGHSFYMNGANGEKFVQQVVPCGWTNSGAKLVLGRGMLINLDILKKEVNKIKEIDPLIETRIFIDDLAGVLSPEFAKGEGHVDGEIHKRIGSTGEGVGLAREARISRGRIPFKLIRDVLNENPWLEPMVACDTPELILKWRSEGNNVMLEGTQGSGLSLIHHGHYPYCTSHDTNAAQLCADIGIPPQLVDSVILVCRTYPIRVAGNSGVLRNEISWDDLSEKLGKDVRETTTVTKKVRRIGEWDPRLVAEAVTLNAPVAIALMFMDYVTPGDEGQTVYANLSRRSKEFVTMVETQTGVPVGFIGTGGTDCVKVIERIHATDLLI